MQEVVIVSVVRSAFSAAGNGQLCQVRPDILLSGVIREVLGRVPQLDYKSIHACAVGCATQEAEQGMNIARWASFLAGLPSSINAFTVSMGECSMLAALDWASLAIKGGLKKAVIVGGVESMSLLPYGGYNPSPSPNLLETKEKTLTPAGIAAENVASKYGILREQQDEYALRSIKQAKEGWNKGFYPREIANLNLLNQQHKKVSVSTDDIASILDMPVMEGRKPEYLKNGTVTKGNSAFAADGAVALVLMSRQMAEENGIPIIMDLRSVSTGSTNPVTAGMAMVPAVENLLKDENISLKDIDLFELHEGYAANLLATCQELKLEDRMDAINCYGGSIALGCPLGAEGGRLISTLVNIMHEKSGTLGLAAASGKGGSGAAVLMERF